MRFTICITLLLFFSVYPVISNGIDPCTTPGVTRIFIAADNISFPQICTYFNDTEISTTSLSSGLYFFSMCYNGGWSNPDQGEDFCYLSGYVGIGTRAEYTPIFDTYVPKFSNLNCAGGTSDISLCGGTLTTNPCGYVTGLSCERCTGENDCLGNSDSICNPDGRCSCKECENGMCHVGDCLCSEGYQGETCEDRVCTPACQNSGECQEGNTCDCSFPYTGHQCEMVVTCNPPCANSSQCLIDVEIGTIFCCNGEVVGNDCITPTTSSTLPSLATPTTLPPVMVTSSLSANEVLLLSVLIVGLMCCIVVGLSCLSITLCVMVTVMMKGKMYKNDKSQPFEMSDYIEERRPTLYSAINENEMLDYNDKPDPPSTRETSTYVEVDHINRPIKKKTSHYEIEDDMLEAKTSISKIDNEATEMYTIREENTVDDQPTPIESPTCAMLLQNDSKWSENSRTYENQEVLKDHQS